MFFSFCIGKTCFVIQTCSRRLSRVVSVNDIVSIYAGKDKSQDSKIVDAKIKKAILKEMESIHGTLVDVLVKFSDTFCCRIVVTQLCCRDVFRLRNTTHARRGEAHWWSVS